LSREARSTATWNFYRFGIVPDAPLDQADEILRESDLTALPEENAEPWFLEGTGQTRTGSTLLIKDLVANASLPFIQTYARLEPLLQRRTQADVRATFRCDYIAGDPSVGVLISDGVREIRLAALQFGGYFGDGLESGIQVDP